MSDEGDSVDFRTFPERLAEELHADLCRRMGLTSPSVVWDALSQGTRRNWIGMTELAIRRIEGRQADDIS